MPFRSPTSMFILAAICAATAACSKTDATAAANVANAAGAPAAPAASTPAAAKRSAEPGASGSYEVVTIERPESVTEFHKLYKTSYDLCAGIRESKKLPPPPAMKQPPAEFISKRNTFASDGKAYLVKTENFRYDVATKDPNPTCETSEQRSTDMELVRDGKIYHVSIDETGKRVSETEDELSMPRKDNEGVYTQPKVIKGFAVKCMPIQPAADKLLTELCIADLKPGTLTQLGGEPIVLYSRVTIVQKLAGAIVTEPLSVKVGQKIDKALFDAAAAP